MSHGRISSVLRFLSIVATVVGVALFGTGARLLWVHDHSGQGMLIHGSADPAVDPALDRTGDLPVGGAPPLSTRAAGAKASFVAGVSADRRYLVDQHGKPYLVRADAPWSILVDLSPADADGYFALRAQQGFNSAIVSLIGALKNGGPSDDGGTYDGVQPFVHGDVTSWNTAYWDRAHAELRSAAAHGITVFLYPIDGWTIGHAFTPRDVDQCVDYGRRVARWAADLPNIVWMTGGDYFSITNEPADGSDVDHCMDGMLRGIRSTGDVSPFSIQLGYEKSISTDNPFWRSRVDWSFAYTYYPTYRAVLESYARTPVLPTIMGEANYEGPDGHPDTPPTTDQTLRRQAAWSLTSGAAGEVYGSKAWDFPDDWRDDVRTRAVTEVNLIRDEVASLPWWRMVPDTADRLVTGGRGPEVMDDKPMDVLDNDYVTAALTPDGKAGLVYVPTARTITLDLGALAPGVHATWVDPTDGARKPVPLSSSLTTPGRNAGGDHDWLLELR